MRDLYRVDAEIAQKQVAVLEERIQGLNALIRELKTRTQAPKPVEGEFTIGQGEVYVSPPTPSLPDASTPPKSDPCPWFHRKSGTCLCDGKPSGKEHKLPKAETCPTCKGMSEIPSGAPVNTPYDDGNKKYCPTCAGTGKLPTEGGGK